MIIRRDNGPIGMVVYCRDLHAGEFSLVRRVLLGAVAASVCRASYAAIADPGSVFHQQ